MIADLSVNHAERQMLLCGFSCERVVHDYGVDLLLFTYSSAGEMENGLVYIQMKATDHPKSVAGGTALAFKIHKADLQTWLAEPLPVILVLYDALRDVAYWPYVQAYFERQRSFRLSQVKKEVTVHIPVENRLDPSAVRRFARFKGDVLRQSKKEIHHRE